MRTLLIFEKIGRMRFLSHLDVIRLFRRAIRRAQIDITYTEGFNPQQKISVTNPLPLGVESEMELMMIETKTPFSETKYRRLNEELPEGMRVRAWREPEEGFDMHTHYPLSEYAWRGITGDEAAALYDAIRARLSEKTLILRKERVKKGKVRMQEKDIRPLIHGVRMEGDELRTTLGSMDAGTLRPGDLLAFLAQDGAQVPEYVVFRRTAQLTESGGPDSCNTPGSVVS